MEGKSCPENIVDYWVTAERFIPHKVDTKNIIGYIKSIQATVLEQKDIAWQSRERFQHKTTPSHTWVYTVFLGIIKCSAITDQMKLMLNDSSIDYDLKKEKGITCLCSFQINNYGELIKDTFTTLDYFVSMSCLNKASKNVDSWMSMAPIFIKKFDDAYDNICDVTKNRKCPTITYEDLEEFLEDILHLSELENFSDLISNTAVIYSSEIPVPNKFKVLDIEYYNEILDDITAPDHKLLNSFYADDLNLVSNVLKSKETSITKALKEYLEFIEPVEKKNLRTDKNLIKKYSCYSYLPFAKWPGNKNHALSLAQQVAVNLALDSDEGLFSINGPPGTGKTTLLRDIISGVITRRAEVLSKYDNPKDAFQEKISTSISGYRYTIWKLDPALIGHEIVIASTNNAAVENISKELPRSSEIDAEYDIDYFAEIASNVLGEDAWGLGSAVLGNKVNCAKFFDKFWNKAPQKDVSDNSYGLNYLLNSMKPLSDWSECKKQFLATKKNLEKLIEELEQLDNALKELPATKKRMQAIDLQISSILTEVSLLENEMIEYNQELSFAESSTGGKSNQLQAFTSLKPAWYIILLDFFKRGSSYKDWNEKCINLIEELNVLNEKKGLLFLKISKLKIKSRKQQDILLQLGKDKLQSLDKVKQFQSTISRMQTYKWISEMPDDKFWSLTDPELQISSPWIHQELQKTRSQLFVDSMNLHKSFIINSSSYICNNMRSAKYMITNGHWPKDLEELTPDLWASFFLIVPTVSTTFASFATLFNELKMGSIGYLLVDEAGQAAPQAALGAIYRSKRAIIVGDPLQILPVVTIPKSINLMLLEYYKVAKKWDVLEESTQTLADRANIYGTFIGKENNGLWIGCPLRVHRRCMEPMFSVSNSIAYDGLMIQATKYRKSSIEQVLPKSLWINVQNGKFDGNWSKDEGEVVIKFLNMIIHSTNTLPSLYIISPFKYVEYNMKKRLRENAWQFSKALSLKEKVISTWINSSVGTVHTFQGKQAEGVIFLIGGNPDPKKTGAIIWASNIPNLLNVAVTRAKNSLFVVGNHSLWSKKPYFQELSSALIKVNPEELFKNEEIGAKSLIPDSCFV